MVANGFVHYPVQNNVCGLRISDEAVRLWLNLRNIALILVVEQVMLRAYMGWHAVNQRFRLACSTQSEHSARQRTFRFAPGEERVLTVNTRTATRGPLFGL